jgi:copper transport protein
VDTIAAVARLVAYLGATWLFGLLVVSRLVLSAAPVATRGTAWAEGRAAIVRRLERSVDVAVLAVAAGTLATLALQLRRVQAAGLAAGTADAAAFVLETGFGQLTVLRLVVVSALWLAIRGSVGRRVLPGGSARPVDRPERVFVTTWFVLAVALLATFPLAGHAGASVDPLLWVPVGVVHVAAASVWVAGIGTLGLVLPAVLSRQRPRTRARVLAPVFQRFARLAAVVVAVLVLTGLLTAAAAVEVGELRSTGYGQALVLKVWLVIWLLALGAVNHLVLVPRLERAAGRRRGGDSETTLAYTVSAEVLLGGVVLAVTAVLTALARP